MVYSRPGLNFNGGRRVWISARCHVCRADPRLRRGVAGGGAAAPALAPRFRQAHELRVRGGAHRGGLGAVPGRVLSWRDRKSGVEGKSGDLGGRRILKKKKNGTS